MDRLHRRGTHATRVREAPITRATQAGRDADNATKRALFDAFDLRIAYDKLRPTRFPISATLTEAVATMLRSRLAAAVVEGITPGEPTRLPRQRCGRITT